MYNVPCIFFSKYVYFSQCVAGYFLDAPCMFSDHNRINQKSMRKLSRKSQNMWNLKNSLLNIRYSIIFEQQKMGYQETTSSLFYLFIFFIFLKNQFIVVQLQWSAFPHHHSPPTQPNPPPSLASTLPLGFVHVSSIVVPENPSPYYPFTPPLWLLIDCS